MIKKIRYVLLFSNLISSILFNSCLNKQCIAADVPHEPGISEDLIEDFTKDFIELMGKTMFGDGSDPLIMPTSEKIHAQRDFDRVLKRNKDLGEYAQKLNDYLRDLHLSRVSMQNSLMKLISDELTGRIPPEQGFGTDFIPVEFPYRQQTLIATWALLSLKAQSDLLMTNLFQNVRFDHTNIGHINQQLKRAVECFELFLRYYEDKTLIDKPKTKLDEYKDSLSEKDDANFELLLSCADNQAFIVHRYYQLLGLETEEQSCRLLLPLANAILQDKNTHRGLKNDNVGKKYLESIIGSIQKYKDMSARLEKHSRDLNTDRKTVASMFDKKSTETKQPQQLLLIREPQKKAEEKLEKPEIAAISSEPPKPSAPPQESVLSAAKTDKMTKEKSLSAQPSASRGLEVRTPATTASSPVVFPTSSPLPAQASEDSNFQPKDDYLTTWLLHSKFDQGTAVNHKKDYQQPSAFELKETRKAQAKEEKRAKAQGKEEERKEEKDLKPTVLPPLPAAEIENIFLLTGNYDVFSSILDMTYTGEMETIRLLITNRFNGTVYLSHGRWHFAIPHISLNSGAVYTSTFEPLEEEVEDVSDALSPLSSSYAAGEQATSPSLIAIATGTAATTVHNPHKKRSKKLRPYHVRTIKEMFERGGYNLETVKEARFSLSKSEFRKKK